MQLLIATRWTRKTLPSSPLLVVYALLNSRLTLSISVTHCKIPQTIQSQVPETRKNTSVPAEDSSHNRDSSHIEHMRGPAGPASDSRIDHSPVRIPGSSLPHSIGSDLVAGPKQAAPTKTKTRVTHSATTFYCPSRIPTLCPPPHQDMHGPQQLTSFVCLVPGLLPHDRRTACVPITVWWSLCRASSAHALKQHHIHAQHACQRSGQKPSHT